MDILGSPPPMTRCSVALMRPGAPALEHLAEIDRERAFEWRHVHPFAMTAARLQAADPVLRQQGQEAAVDVRRAGHVAALAFVHHPHARIRRGSLLRIGAQRIADQPQRRESRSKASSKKCSARCRLRAMERMSAWLVSTMPR